MGPRDRRAAEAKATQATGPPTVQAQQRRLEWQHAAAAAAAAAVRIVPAATRQWIAPTSPPLAKHPRGLPPDR